MWSRPVAEEWAEQRRRDPDALKQSVSVIADSDIHGQDGDGHPIGIANLWDRYTRNFMSQLWRDTATRKRWALRWRTEPAVHQVARDLAWDVAAGITRVVPVYDIALTVQMAILGDLANAQKRKISLGVAPGRRSFGISPQITRTLDWLIRHEPNAAASAIGELIGQAKDDLGVPAEVMERTLRTALSMHGELAAEAARDFLDRVFTPTD
jgi:hypothetical protein